MPEVPTYEHILAGGNRNRHVERVQGCRCGEHTAATVLASELSGLLPHRENASEGRPGEGVKDVRFTEDALVVDLLDGRTISVPLVWYPRLLSATPEQRANWRRAGGDSVSTGRTSMKT